MHHEGECVDIDELCEDYYFYSIELKACSQVVCPDYYYVDLTGMNCKQTTCGRGARL